MKINIEAIDRNSFMVHENIVNGELMYLVQPRPVQPRWTQATKIFRSSLWSADGELVSAGFPKFTNWNEAPEEFPVPTDLKDATIVEKLDGSLLIASKWKGQFIIRTRGTTDASELTNNGFELAELMKRYPAIKQYQPYFETWPFSLLFEWTSPLQKIVIDYGDKSNIRLVGVIEHRDYSLWTQTCLNGVAKQLGVERPATYTFTTIADLMSQVDVWNDKEGVCIYSKNGQVIHKVKAARYLLLHRMKSELSSLEKVMDVWFNMGMPDFNTFYNNIATQFDFELANQCRGFMSNILDAWKEVQKIEEGFKRFIAVELSKYPTRKLQAAVTFQSYGKNNSRAGMVFTLLDGKTLPDKDYKKLLFQVLKSTTCV